MLKRRIKQDNDLLNYIYIHSYWEYFLNLEYLAEVESWSLLMIHLQEMQVIQGWKHVGCYSFAVIDERKEVIN